jgi:hypothetical protein
MWESLWALHHTFNLEKSPLDLSEGFMRLMIGFVGLFRASHPQGKPSLMLTCGEASMVTPKDCI